MSNAVALYGFGGGGGSGGTLTVTAPAGVTVTIAKDGKEKTKVADASGVAVFKGLPSGTWMVTIDDGTDIAKKYVEIDLDYTTMIDFNKVPEFTYTGDYEIVNDGDERITTSRNNWKIRLLTSGTLTFTNLNGAENGIDVFLVGGASSSGYGPSNYYGDGGDVRNEYGVKIEQKIPYDIVIGAGGPSGYKQNASSAQNGGETTAFSYTAAGGTRASITSPGARSYEFDTTSGKRYGGAVDDLSIDLANTGSGSHNNKTSYNAAGGSGIVIIRNAREVV